MKSEQFLSKHAAPDACTSLDWAALLVSEGVKLSVTQWARSGFTLWLPDKTSVARVFTAPACLASTPWLEEGAQLDSRWWMWVTYNVERVVVLPDSEGLRWAIEMLKVDDAAARLGGESGWRNIGKL